MFDKFESVCIELLDSLPKRHSKNCFRSALHHLEKATHLSNIDPAMAIFRGITAEEEAASGLMYCLRECNYLDAKRLNPRKHIHKHALIPFLRIVGLFHGQLFEKSLKEYRLDVKEEDGQKRLMLAFPIVHAGTRQWAYPIPPLNVGVSVGASATPPSYQTQISAYVEANGAKDILSYLKNEANLRNKILYASPAGYPTVPEPNPEFLHKKVSHVFILLQTYLLIAPYAERQRYVQDALGAFLTMVGALEQQERVSTEG